MIKEEKPLSSQLGAETREMGFGQSSGAPRGYRREIFSKGRRDPMFKRFRDFLIALCIIIAIIAILLYLVK